MLNLVELLHLMIKENNPQSHKFDFVLRQLFAFNNSNFPLSLTLFFNFELNMSNVAFKIKLIE